MRDASEPIDSYLINRFGVGLERVLLDASAGLANPVLAGSVRTACDPVGAFTYEDGGISELYQGVLTLEGVTYRYRCAIFTDAGGARFLEDLGEVEAVRWEIGLVVPRHAAAS
ncbi:MAG: hypothetical protein JWL84_3051 [Rhodospirillales bacterium]|jgi:hypothetical protein|nr:hypothetical protein [Rhodospirillales bacterium]